MIKKTNNYIFAFPKNIKRIYTLCIMFVTVFLFAQTNNKNDNLSFDELLQQYIQTKGDGIILFDTSNIKQFWIDNSVVSRNNLIEILLEDNKKSVPLKLQLLNVNEAQDCKVEVIADQSDMFFEVLNNSSQVISKSMIDEDFIQSHIYSSTFHLEDTKNASFYLKFASSVTDIISVRKIILSFSQNKNGTFLSSPGKIIITEDNSTARGGTITPVANGTFTLAGKNSSLYANNRIIISNNPINFSVKIKNSGAIPTNLYYGYVVYTKDGINLGNVNYPYKGINNILKIVSSKDNSASIIVDSYPQWRKNCTIAIDVKEDMSDLPNSSLIEGNVLEVKELENGTAEIVFDKPYSKALETGTKIRIHGSRGGDLYLGDNVYKQLQPGQEFIINSTIQKDDDSLVFSAKAFSRGAYYIIPIIRSFSFDSKEENIIEISDFSISY